MFTKAELLDAIDQLMDGKHSIQSCEKLAAIYTVMDHLYAPDVGYSNDNKVIAETKPVIGYYGDSDFLLAIEGKNPEQVWPLIDELIEALSVLNPRLLSNFFDKLYQL